jgi:hypothetical protein|tara:strand:+ start:798 stop:1049 length:252 start_codon:yes stop_codon:yes gene_type:complete
MGTVGEILGFALIVGYVILTIAFSFTLSFHIGLLMGAVGYVLYEILKFIYPYVKFFKGFMKFLGFLFVLYIVIMIFGFMSGGE